MGFLQDTLSKLFGKGVTMIFGHNPFRSQEYIEKIYENPSFTLAEEKKTKALKAVEWGIFKEDKEGNKEELTEHTLSPVFQMPNNNITWGEFLEQLTIWYDAQDNGVLLEKVTGIPSMKPTLNIYNPNNFSVKFNGSQVEKITITNPNKVIEGDDLQDYMWIRQPNPYQSMAGAEFDTESTGNTVQRGMALLGSYIYNAWNWNDNLVKKSGKRSGVFSGDRPIKPDEKKKLKQKYMASSGPENVGEPIIASGGLDFKPFDVEPHDADWIEGEKTAHERIASSIGVPPELVSAGESTYSNRKEARKELYNETILPWCRELAKRLNVFLSPWLENGEMIDFKTDSIPALQTDIAEAIDNLESLKDRVKVNEYRQILSDLADYDLPSLDGKIGDKVLVSSTSATLEELTKDIEPKEDVTE